MTQRRNPVATGRIVDTRATLTLTEFSRACGVEVEIVREMVIEGVIEPSTEDSQEWRFSGEALVRAQCALRLVEDLSVNWPGAALALELLERLEQYEQHGATRRRNR